MFRHKAHSGIWVCFLIPLAFASSLYNARKEYAASDILAASLSLYFAVMSLPVAYRMFRHNYDEKARSVDVVYDLFWKDFVSRDLIETRTRKKAGKKNEKPKKLVGFNYRLYLSVIYSNALYFWGPTGGFGVLVLTLPFLHVYPIVLSKLYSSCPGSFTFGEGAAAVQACLIFVYKQALDFLLDIEDGSSVEGAFVIIGRAGLCSLLLLFAVSSRKSTWFYVTAIFIVTSLLTPYLWLKLLRNPFLWLLEYVAADKKRPLLVGLWLGCVLVSIAVVKLQTSKETSASTSVRKYFHAAIAVVYVSGALLDERFLYLASMAALAAFLLIEFIRLYRVEPFGPTLDYYFKVFLDEKDGGVLVLTNIYLLAGCSAPLWLDCGWNNRVLAALSGVLATGIGDSAASVVGSKFGRRKWPKSDKSLEGTAASIVAQMAAVWALKALGYYDKDIWGLVLPVSAVAVVEALTDQVDNLVLPPLLYSMLCFY